jgi:hypothetical protein
MGFFPAFATAFFEKGRPALELQVLRRSSLDLFSVEPVA